MMTDDEDIKYPPSILIVEESALQNLKLRRRLEKKGCQVYKTNLEGLNAVRQEYFDLVVLNIDLSNPDALQQVRKLKTWPELAGVPIVMLMPDDLAENAINELNNAGTIHHFSEDAFTQARLIQIIKQVHYMTYRYH